VSAAPIIYLGPSLPRNEAERILPGDYRPPVRRGDLSTHSDGRTVVIIDGEFGQSLAVSPKEILRLLDQGTRVIGASSMGALRAAELCCYGMQGVGWVFDAYRSGRITRDDEVAVMYSPVDFQPLTIPVVNVRYWLRGLRERALVDTPVARRVLSRTRRLFFAERTPIRLKQELRGITSAPVFEEFSSVEPWGSADVKAADARLALASIASDRSSPAH